VNITHCIYNNTYFAGLCRVACRHTTLAVRGRSVVAQEAGQQPGGGGLVAVCRAYAHAPVRGRSVVGASALGVPRVSAGAPLASFSCGGFGGATAG
jgi:hypothetical protein